MEVILSYMREGDVSIRYEGPRGAPGMPEMLSGHRRWGGIPALVFDRRGGFLRDPGPCIASRQKQQQECPSVSCMMGIVSRSIYGSEN